MENSPAFTVEIWSDVVCPFCYLGKRKFENTLEQFESKDKVHVIWKSFQLNPGVTTDPEMSVYTYLSQAKGITESVARQMTQQIKERGEEVGINYDFDSTRVNNTYLAHCFLHFALEKNKQNEAKEKLLNAYFEKGENVDDLDLLVRLGNELGFNEQEVRGNLQSDKYRHAVKKDMELGAKFGIRGVPFFVFDRKYAVSGAQETPVFLQTLVKAFDEWMKAGSFQAISSSEGDSCSTEEGNCL
jgi:predicted DsbA family dithiol-disulfide isomerase